MQICLCTPHHQGKQKKNTQRARAYKSILELSVQIFENFLLRTGKTVRSLVHKIPA